MKLSIPFYKDYAEAQPKNDFLRLGGNFSKYFVASLPYSDVPYNRGVKIKEGGLIGFSEISLGRG